MARIQFHATDTAIRDTIAQAKLEIRADVADGTVPATVASFSELHDYVDANCYGGMCEDGHAFWRNGDGSAGEDGFDCDVDAANAVQDAVHAWIVAGGITTTPDLLTAAREMLDDLDGHISRSNEAYIALQSAVDNN
jgi:hypothetical protein